MTNQMLEDALPPSNRTSGLGACGIKAPRAIGRLQLLRKNRRETVILSKTAFARFSSSPSKEVKLNSVEI